MKHIEFILLFCLLGLFACNRNTLNKATVSFYNKDKFLDSTVIIDKAELGILEKFLLTKTPFSDKLPVKYFLKIDYNNGKTEEYSCNGYFIKDNQTYINTDTIIRNNFLRVINSKLPTDLKQ
jgi:hypothetical protein